MAQFNFLPGGRDENDVIDRIQPIFVRTTKGDLDLPPKTEEQVPLPMSPTQERMYNIIRDEELLQLEGSECG